MLCLDLRGIEEAAEPCLPVKDEPCAVLVFVERPAFGRAAAEIKPLICVIKLMIVGVGVILHGEARHIHAESGEIGQLRRILHGIGICGRRGCAHRLADLRHGEHIEPDDGCDRCRPERLAPRADDLPHGMPAAEACWKRVICHIFRDAVHRTQKIKFLFLHSRCSFLRKSPSFLRVRCSETRTRFSETCCSSAISAQLRQ